MNLNQLHSILRKLKFFKQYSKDRCFELLEHSTYQFFHQGEVIFKEGDFADKIFVILQGSVSVQQEYKGLNIYVNSRYDGDTIGEYALARGSVEKSFAKRSATCIAGESLHTLFITSDDYMEIMNKAADNENAIIAHLKEFRLFQHIQNVDLAYLANCLHVTVYAFEECILQAGLVPKGLYLIVNGRVKAVYKNKVVELPPKYFFGQKVMLGEFKPSSCQILSNAVETSIILIEPSLIGLIYKQVRDITMSILALHEKQDL
jgi:CRP-like cAMP-binding protein